MKLSEIFDDLTYGELSQVAIGGGDKGEIEESNYPRILSHINLALTTLYTRFYLRENKIVLRLIPGLTLYNLESKYSMYGRRGTQGVRYIIDTPENPFKDDILKVEGVNAVNEEARSFYLNDYANSLSITTPTVKTIWVPPAISGKYNTVLDEYKTDELLITYRANHPKIVQNLGYFNPEQIELMLPDTHRQALLYFVASRVNNPIGMSQEFHAGNSWAAKFEQECQQLEHHGMRIDKGSERLGRFQRNGWK